jgi:uncharacterized protein (TIGR01777 family)
MDRAAHVLNTMTIVIAGGSGLLGTALAGALTRDGNAVTILTRGSGSEAAGVRRVSWAPDGKTGSWADSLAGADAVVNLAGESIAAGRWSAARKQRIEASRLLATRSLVAAIAAQNPRPRVFVSASAVGYYGPCGDEIVTEATPPGRDFLAGLCVRWEAEAERAAELGVRVLEPRTGLVLARGGGALPKMLLPFRLGAGGPLASGHQYWPWIHVDDWVRLVSWSIGAPAVSGPINATAPSPVTNAEFSKSLGRALHRPAVLPAPAFALRLILGEMADALLLSGQRAIPAKAEAAGFVFRFTTLGDALGDIFTPAQIGTGGPRK